MIVVTATLLFVLLVFAPFYLRVDVSLYFKRLAADVNIGIGAVDVIKENVRIANGSICCNGTITTDVGLKNVDRKNGIELLKCITVDKIAVSVYNNFTESFTKRFAIQNSILALATATACNLFHCQLYSECLGTLNENRVRVRAAISFSVAELSFCLLKQGVRKWKTHKSEK